MLENIKRLGDKVPYFIGQKLGLIPYNIRLGHVYDDFKRLIDSSEIIQKNTQISLVDELVRFAYTNTTFYKEFYDKQGYVPGKIDSLNQLNEIPIVTKTDLFKVPLDDRSVKSIALKKCNTGGTTGQPLDFYIEKSAYAREWAHMHAIWATLGYCYNQNKITIRGKNIGFKFYKYNFNQNEFLINAYSPLVENIEEFRNLVKKRNIQWIHGYPSSVYSFLLELEKLDSKIFDQFISRIKGVFLGSEFPAPQYRKYIESYCGLKTISWYGHSEMAVLAYEKEPGSGNYYPFQSYGIAEAVPEDAYYRLVVTSIYNYATPLIRYDTGDFIEPIFKNGLMEYFRIKEGRNSEFVVDKNGRNISLTALIFGRHHKAFDFVEHIQVRQIMPGKIDIIICSQKSIIEWSKLFDFNHTYFDIHFQQVDKPFITPNGKVKLLII
jgi:phenylacetate-CoA ligase